MQTNRLYVVGVAALASAVYVSLFCADSPLAAQRKAAAAGPRDAGGDAGDPRSVELFRAVEAGDVEVKLIPKNATLSNVLLKNTSNMPLRIKMPAAFAGVPVLAQQFDAGGGGRDRGGGGGNSTNQSIGGGFGGGGLGGGLGGGGGGLGGGFFNVRPGAVRKTKVTTVCLEHGSPAPNPRIPYVLRPIEDYTTDKAVIELCKMLGRGDIDQHAAQAVAWHLSDSLDWQQLATKVRVRHLNGATELWFGHHDLLRAIQISGEIRCRAAMETDRQRSLDDTGSEGRYAQVRAES